MKIKDSFDRTIDYVRVAVTDRCNLRCFYCMPSEGIPYEPKAHLLSYEEIIRLLGVLKNMGFTKVRFTGGEPFLRKDFITLLENTVKLLSFDSLHITSNGTLIEKHIPTLKELGIRHINLSLDTLNPARFKKITRRDDFDTVLRTFYNLLDNAFQIKINTVVMPGINTQDIIPLAQLAQKHDVSIRFIEEMPFNGGYKQNTNKFSASRIFETLHETYPDIKKESGYHGDTSTHYTIPDFKGNIGIIAAFTRTFCTTCNRLRITSKGAIKTCLYDGGVFSMRDYMRSGVSDHDLMLKFQELIKHKPKDGFAAEDVRKKTTAVAESMSMIGG